MVKSLLIVDDDPAQRRILEEMIKRLGFNAKTASSGEQALQLLEGPERSEICLVLLDLVMDGIDGMAVLDKLNGKPGLPPSSCRQRTDRLTRRLMPCAPARSTSW